MLIAYPIWLPLRAGARNCAASILSALPNHESTKERKHEKRLARKFGSFFTCLPFRFFALRGFVIPFPGN